MYTQIHTPGDPVGDILFNWLPLIAVVAIGGIGLFIILRGYRGFVKAVLLKRLGRKGRATVMEKFSREEYLTSEERRHRKPGVSHYLVCERTDGGRVFSSEELAPSELWREVEPGDEVDVIYLPGRATMKLEAQPEAIGLVGSAVQLAAGAVMISVSAGVLLTSALDALGGPERRAVDPNWVRDQAEVIAVGPPADPYLRLLAPEMRYLYVLIGDTQGGALAGTERLVLVSPDQVAGLDISEGAILPAWVDPENDENAILDLERDRSAR